MPPDKPDIQGMISGMPPKQKMTIGLMVVVVGVIIWQVMGLMGGSSPKPTPSATPKITANKPGTPPSGGSAAPVAMASANNPSAVQPQEVPAPKPAPVQPAVDEGLMKLQKQAQEKYLAQTAQLQALKLDQQIAETNSAIAAAKLSTFTSEKAISDMLAASVPAPVSSSSYGNIMGSKGTTQASGTTDSTAITPPPPTTATVLAPKLGTYTLVSVSMQLQRWTAVIGYGDKLYTVNVGDVLPPDGSVVESIDKDNVVLKKDGKNNRISLVPSV